MENWENNYISGKVTINVTGDEGLYDDFKIIEYPFGNYTIKVKLAPSNEFLGITEIQLNKDFLDLKQKISSRGYLDIEEYYRD
ncbi:MAG TPA: hypothetical protein PLK11_08260 [Methanofastidiosum sp.]|nr:MAG: hypothetical protein BWX72_00161 [Firmicutes bacterium ADurb.Bin080]HOE92559.1 hypothetical protein [Methanofastidiosum sp.]HOR88834.1 hypothetical protein [Methanofastidiosum sp.]HPL01318.1 hypothetical protein [Methanofastidiosum sp.]